MLLAVLVAGVAARAPTDLGPVGYHARVGIPLATAVRAAEVKAQASRIFNGSPAELGQFPYYVSTLELISNRRLIEFNRILTRIGLHNNCSLLAFGGAAAREWQERHGVATVRSGTNPL